MRAFCEIPGDLRVSIRKEEGRGDSSDLICNTFKKCVKLFLNCIERNVPKLNVVDIYIGFHINVSRFNWFT